MLLLYCRLFLGVLLLFSIVTNIAVWNGFVDLQQQDEAVSLSIRSRSRSLSSRRTTHFHVVISHCDRSLDWIWNDALQFAATSRKYKLRSITIISKCGIPINDQPPRELWLRSNNFENNNNNFNENNNNNNFSQDPLLAIVRNPNVGRCDHSYAYWITAMLHDGNTTTTTTANEQHNAQHHHNAQQNEQQSHHQLQLQRIARSIRKDDLVLFIKDTENLYRRDWEDNASFPQLLDALDDDDTNTVPLHKTTAAYRKRNNVTIKTNDALWIPNTLMYSPTGSMGSVCESSSKLLGIYTDWAHRSVLWTFSMNNYKHRTTFQSAANETSKTNTTKTKTATKLQQQQQQPQEQQPFTSEHRPMGNWIHHLSTQTAKQTIVQEQEEHRRLDNNYNDYNNDNDNISDYSRNNVFSKAYERYAIETTVLLEDSFFVKHSKMPKHNKTSNSGALYRKKDLVPVCFGGIFATRWGQLSAKDAPLTPYGWTVVTKALARGDNIEEGHYMERLWADLLTWSSYSSTRMQQQQSYQQQRRQVVFKDFFGSLTNDQQQDLLDRKFGDSRRGVLRLRRMNRATTKSGYYYYKIATQTTLVVVVVVAIVATTTMVGGKIRLRRRRRV